MPWKKRWAYAAWVFVIGLFAMLHAMHLRADFPNHSAWVADWAKYTDEGWPCRCGRFWNLFFSSSRA
jgi:hypothetical protein